MAAVAATGLASAIHLLVGRRLLVALLEWSTRIERYAGETRWLLEETIARLPDLMLAKLIVLVWIVALVALGAVAAAGRRPRRRRPGGIAGRLMLGAATLLLLYYCIESFVAPFLIKRLGLENFYVRLNPDHRMPPAVAAIPTNADGIRCPRESDAYTPDKFNVIFLGDSYAFGKKVKGWEAFPYLAEKILLWPRSLGYHPNLSELQVANFAWVTSCPLLSYRLLLDIGEKYNPDMIVACIDMTDFHDDIYYGMVIDGRGIYRLFDKFPITLRVLKDHWPAAFWKLYWGFNRGLLPEKRFFVSEQPLAQSRPHLAAIRRNLDAIHRYAESHGARFVVVVLPRAYQYSRRESPRSWERDQYTILGPHSLEPFRYFEELRESVDYPIYSLLEDFRDIDVFPTCFEDDPHWNVAGHKVAARGVARLLRKEIERLDVMNRVQRRP